MTTTKVVLSVAALGLLLSASAALGEVRFTLMPGMSAPITPYLDGYPIPVDPDGCAGAALDLEEARPNARLVENESDIGFSMTAGLIANDWEITYGFSRHTWGALRYTGASFCFEEDNAFNDVFFDWGSLSDLGLDGVPDVGRDGLIVRDADDVGLDPLYIHRILVGYRFYLVDGTIRPYIPVAIGPTIVHTTNSSPLFGATIQLGLGMDVALSDRTTMGIDLRYSADITESPAAEVASLRRLAIQSNSSNSSLFESVVEVFQAIVLSATVSYEL